MYPRRLPTSLAIRTFRPTTSSVTAQTRLFSLSAPRTSDGSSKDTEHGVNKANKGNKSGIEEEFVKSGMDEANTEGSGGSATEGKDSADGVAKAKKEHPEAPDPAIGMQDERGGRGG